MFHKKYKVKTSTAVKGSERKKLQSQIRLHLPRLSEEALNTLISSKSELTQVKALAHSGEVILIYCVSSIPMVFSVNEQIFPTVYLLWKCPNLLPTLPMEPVILEKICNGADLMAPGIIVNESTLPEFEALLPKAICAVRLAGSMTPIAVGTAAMSALEIAADGRRGKAVLITHCYRDNLWLSGDESHPPLIPEVIINKSVNCKDSEENENFDGIERTEDELHDIENNVSSIVISGSDSTVVDVECDEEADETTEPSAIQYTMDDILNQCFMLCLKIYSRKIELPILTSTFYRTHVLSCCPSDLNLDIKKTTYKKLSLFLKKMAVEGLIDVKELSKGVESIVTINAGHPSISGFCPDQKFKEHVKRQKEDLVTEEASKHIVQDNYTFPDIVEMFAVSGQVKSVFEGSKFRKGDAMTIGQIREVLREYVKQNSLIQENNSRMVVLDPVLTSSLLKPSESKSSMTWEELHEKILSRMSPAYQITFEGEEPKLRKGHIEPIEITVATRSGNKKVTLIRNLENFGIKPQVLANHMQVAAAASTSIGQVVGGKGDQVLIQGKQLHYLQKLLFDIYKVPKKYVKGLENVSAKKKK